MMIIIMQIRKKNPSQCEVLLCEALNPVIVKADFPKKLFLVLCTSVAAKSGALA